MEEASFARYVLRGESKASSNGRAVNAYLCEVSRQVSPEESKRKPTWFSAQDSKKRLRERRTSRDIVEFARVVDKAVCRIEALSSSVTLLEPDVPRQDALRRVPFEASEVQIHGIQQSAFRGNSAAAARAVNAHLRRILQLNFTQLSRPVQTANPPVKQLLRQLNPLPAMAHVIEIDQPHGSPNKARISTRKTRRNRPTIG